MVCLPAFKYRLALLEKRTHTLLSVLRKCTGSHNLNCICICLWLVEVYLGVERLLAHTLREYAPTRGTLKERTGFFIKPLCGNNFIYKPPVSRRLCINWITCHQHLNRPLSTNSTAYGNHWSCTKPSTFSTRSSKGCFFRGYS